MTSADVQNGKLNWLWSALTALIAVGSIVYMAGVQSQALEPRIAVIEAKADARDRESEGIAKRLDRIENKLDALIGDRPSPRR